MMRALFAGVTGLRSHQTKMDVIGNNISNVNTLGFKKSAANFADLYSETTAAATGPAANKGGTNASQVGLGVTCNAIVVKHTPGAAQYTGNTLDLAISGDGYFSVRVGEDGNLRYTRDGALHVSSNGSLVTSSGYFVQCFNSMYREGTAGTVTGTAGVTNASVTGFNGFTYDDGDNVTNVPSGTYSFELDDLNRVQVYKNGVEYKDPVDVIDVTTGEPLTAGIGFNPNHQYRITLPDNLGTISFVADGNSLTATPIKEGTVFANIDGSVSIKNVTFEQTDASKAFAAEMAPGDYKLNADADGVLTIQATGLEDVSMFLDKGLFGSPTETGDTLMNSDSSTWPDPAALPTTGNATYVTKDKKYSATVTAVPATGNQPATYNVTITPLAADAVSLTTLSGTAPTGNLKAGTGYVLNTPVGKYTFVPEKEIAYDPDDAGATIKNVVDALNGNATTQPTYSVKAPTTTGGEDKAFNTGLGYLNSLLMSATVTIANNDGFYAGSQRSDMVINPDLYENVMITEDGAVVAQLKRKVDGSTTGIFGMNSEMGAGERITLGYLAMANFTNAEGLEKIGTNLYQTTANSGQAMFSLAGDNGVGALATSSLEMSNVDLSEEMVNMITTQRGFQANSRIITVTDTMLEELINLKR